MLNRFTIAGYLGAEPECTSSDTIPSCTLSVGVEKNTRDEEGNWKKGVEWLPVKVFRQQATNCIAYLTKGSWVVIQGRIKKNVWKTDDGRNRSKLDLIASSVRFGPKPKDQDTGTQEEQRPLTPAQQRAAELRQERETVPTNQYPEDEIPS